jgi:ribosomal protein S18 acetylase RimI-like enzyme
MSFSCEKVKAEDTHQIRHTVLWPHRPFEHCILAEDKTAEHFGGFINEKLISVASLFPEGNKTMRLRKFAILPEFQRQGVGTKMLQNIFKHMAHNQTEFIWCDAREEAVNFYKKIGFETEGMRFFKHDIPYFKMKINLNTLS